jgi:hypothetical protein
MKGLRFSNAAGCCEISQNTLLAWKNRCFLRNPSLRISFQLEHARVGEKCGLTRRRPKEMGKVAAASCRRVTAAVRCQPIEFSGKMPPLLVVPNT